MKLYHKLVRDNIPQIIEATGKSCKVSRLSEEEYLSKLEEKLSEELLEYQESKALEELADLLEVMEATVIARGSTWEQLVAVKEEKKAKRGGFAQKLLLEAVYD